jgi:hypothetical protein
MGPESTRRRSRRTSPRSARYSSARVTAMASASIETGLSTKS